MWDLSSPWAALRDKPYVLAEDSSAIKKHNDKYEGTVYEIHRDVVPEPFIGNPRAPLWLLNLNPGFEEADLHHSPETVEMQKRSAALEADDFWFIDDRFKTAPGHAFWTKRLREPIRRWPDQVKTKIFCVELFPYHSTKYKWNGGILPSQKFTLALVRRAVVEGKKFIIMRQKNNWLNLIGELKNARYTTLRSFRNVVISSGNLNDPTILTEIFGQ